MKSLFTYLAFIVILASCHYSTPRTQHFPTDTISDPRRDQLAYETLITHVGKTASGSRNNAISGKCQLASGEESQIKLPCSNIEISLVDENQKEIMVVPVREGEFFFPVEKDQSFYLYAKSDRHELSKEKNGPFKRGDNVLLTIKKVTP